MDLHHNALQDTVCHMLQYYLLVHYFSEIEVGDEVSASADFGVRVSGDSMEPLYLDGQIIWIHKQDTLEEGEIGIFFLDGEAFVKKYHQTDSGVQLISLNSKYSPISY